MACPQEDTTRWVQFNLIYSNPNRETESRRRPYPKMAGVHPRYSHLINNKRNTACNEGPTSRLKNWNKTSDTCHRYAPMLEGENRSENKQKASHLFFTIGRFGRTMELSISAYCTVFININEERKYFDIIYGRIHCMSIYYLAYKPFSHKCIDDVTSLDIFLFISQSKWTPIIEAKWKYKE